MQIYDQTYKCYGCGKCASVCPTDAITMMPNNEGFLYPHINQALCVDCGQCSQECIFHLNLQQKQVPVHAYACTALDDSIVNQSSSGGIFSLLAQAILDSGGIVYGATFSSNGHIVHKRVATLDSLSSLQGTKYVQSNIIECFSQIAADSETNKRILFSGTPCQIAAIKSFLKKDTPNICYLEVVCMGCPSPGVWEKYISEKRNIWGNISNVNFRDKITGWRESSISYTLTNNEKKHSKHSMDIYMTGFKQALFFRPSCHECLFKGDQTLGDIKIGDFWGIDNYNSSYKERNGVSLVIPETEHGLAFFNEVRSQLSIDEIPYKYALSHNPYIKLSKKPSKNRRAFFNDFSTNTSSANIYDLIKEHLLPKFNEKDRFWCQYPVVESLLKMNIYGNGASDFFSNNGYKKIAIYGLGDLGKTLIQNLKKTNIEIVCLVDRNYSRFPNTYDGIKVIGPHQLENEDYDCIVVTLVHLYNSILEVLLVEEVDLNKIISIGSII